MTDTEGGKSSTGLEANIAGGLCYLLGFITGVVFLILEKDSRYVRFHAMQSTMLFGGVFVLNVVLTAVPLIGWLINLLLIPVTLILWILLMIKGFQGPPRFKLPVVGDLAEKQI